MSMKILSQNDMRIRVLTQKAAVIKAALINANLDAELEVFERQFNIVELMPYITGAVAETLKKSLEIWYQDYVS